MMVLWYPLNGKKCLVFRHKTYSCSHAFNSTARWSLVMLGGSTKRSLKLQPFNLLWLKGLVLPSHVCRQETIHWIFFFPYVALFSLGSGFRDTTPNVHKFLICLIIEDLLTCIKVSYTKEVWPPTPLVVRKLPGNAWVKNNLQNIGSIRFSF